MPCSTDNPWTTLSSKLVYENAWIRVREDQVIRPDKQPGIYGVIETHIATGVVAVTSDNEIVLVGQYRYPIETYSWEIVEGAARKGENPIDAVRRELQEEAGLVARNVIQLGPKVHLSNCMTNEIAMLYLAWDLTETKAAPEGTEVLTLKRMKLSEVQRLIAQGVMTDAMSVIAVERAARLLAGQDLTLFRGE